MSTPIRSITHQLEFAWRRITASQRVMPSFLIIGAAKCGTTSLYNYLIRHPRVAACFKKEVHYFDYYHHKGESWYRAHFPLQYKATEGKLVAGESSPYYLAHPLAPGRVAAELPKVKLICMLRNPVDRAISSFQNQVRLGIEPLTSFEAALEAENDRILGHELRLEREPGYSSFEHKYFSYFHRGCYAIQLKRWMNVFPADQLLIIRSESFFADPQQEFKRVLRFLELPSADPDGGYKVYNAGGEYDAMSPQLRSELLERYRPHNEEFFRLIGERFSDWDR
ncbi:MAG: sulfotransferase domain-containing protein [Sphingobacteriales bacterium]|nr:sulfotransferase domain-containing protein [Sphingobacteriales bacterium]